MDSIFMCKVCEIGKYVVNKCLARNIFINTQKLEKLLVVMQIEHMVRVKKELFPENILIRKCGVVIKEVDEGFVNYALGFEKELEPFIILLEEQQNTIERVLEQYGNLSTYEINELPEVQYLVARSVLVNGEKVICPKIMQGFYM